MSRARLAFAGSVVVLTACTSIIGVRDLSYDPNAGETGGEAGADGQPPPGVPPPGGGDGGGGDSATCVADLQTDAKNCGACGHDCIGGACANGQCKPVAFFTTDSPRYVQANATEIIFTDDKLDAVRAIDKTTNTVRTICTMPAGSGVNELVIDATNAYFTFSQEADGNTVGGIAKCAIAATNGAPTVIAPGQSYPGSLVLDGTTLYWATNGNPQPIWQLVSGGSPKQITTGDPGATANLGAFSGFLYVANDVGNGTLKRCSTVPSGSCTLATIATDNDGIDAVYQLGENLLWGQGVYPATIYEGLPDGGGKNAVTGSGEIAHSFVADDKSFLWLNSGVRNSGTGDYDQGWVGRCPHTNGIVSCGTSGPENVTGKTMLFVRGLTKDGVAFYWVDSSTNGGIWRLAR